MNNRGRTADVEFWKSLYGSSNTINCSYYGGSSGYGNSYYDSDIYTRKDKRKHQFTPVFLIMSTVYDCEHCKRKKEDCSYEYCEDEDSPPDTWDTGGW